MSILLENFKGKIKNLKKGLNEELYNQASALVRATNDYEKFDIFPGNREIVEKNVKAKMKDIQKRGLLNPITVDEKYRIIDGQSRFVACEILGYPIQYIIKDKSTVDDLIAMNNNVNKWNLEDYVEANIADGDENYVLLKHYSKKYNGLGYQVTASALWNVQRIPESYFREKYFYIEEDKINEINLKRFREIANIIKLNKGNEKVWRVIHVFFQDPAYDHERMTFQLNEHFKMISNQPEYKNCSSIWNISKIRLGVLFLEVYNRGFNYSERMSLFDEIKLNQQEHKSKMVTKNIFLKQKEK